MAGIEKQRSIARSLAAERMTCRIALDVRFGLDDASSELPLAVLAHDDLSEQETREVDRISWDLFAVERRNFDSRGGAVAQW